MKKILLTLLLSVGIPQTIIDPITLVPPATPTIYATAEHGRIFISWDNVAEISIDSVTHYSDFEGYRLYKSTDGGETWGSVDDRLYNNDGDFVGWRPFGEFDLSQAEDENHCIYSYSNCVSGLTRDTSFTGLDPYNKPFSLGTNTGLVNSYIDEDVYDGIQYTYCITAFDIGLQTYTVEYSDDDGNGIYEADTLWMPTNPDHYTVDSLGTGYKSLESPIGTSDADPNFVTIVPGYNASNITFPDPNNTASFIRPMAENVGNGNVSYFVADRDNLTSKLVKFEVNAWLPTASDIVENRKNANPMVYVYAIDDSVNQLPIETTAYDTTGLTNGHLDSLLEMPGTELVGDIIYVPNYLETVRPTDGPSSFYSAVFDGIRVKFENPPSKYNVDLQPIADWSMDADSSTINSIFLFMNYKDQAYKYKPGFNYKIRFLNQPEIEVERTIPPQGCNALLPFEIINMNTGKRVGIYHNDYGVDNEFNTQDDGEFDCYWTPMEELTFQLDTLNINGTPQPKATYTINLGILYQSAIDIGTEIWSAGKSYDSGNQVYYEGLIWKAGRDITESFTPQDFIDTDLDGINDNPWYPVYPWDEGDELILYTNSWYEDGDAWLADLSVLGKPHKITTSDLNEVSVVPNPYIVHSAFNETSDERRILFSHLPTECRIQIFTVSGERLKSIVHSDPYDGNEFWNLRTENNQEIAPGLYIYVVESGSKKHVGKFAVVR